MNQSDPEIYDAEEESISIMYSSLPDEEVVKLCHQGDSFAEEYLLNKYN